MKICIYGAGAIGSYIGVMLARSGIDVSLIARGAHLKAMKKNGVTVTIGQEKHTASLRCTENPQELDKQDYIFVTLKSHSISGIASVITPLCKKNTAVVTASNGIPWWYFYKVSGQWENHCIETVDPAGQQWRYICPERAIGCIIYSAASITSPGHVEVVPNSGMLKLPLGEPSGILSERITILSRALMAAGFRAPIKTDIRTELWVKLWGNLAFNPISVLTGSTLESITGDPKLRALAKEMMLEAQEVAKCLGITFPISIDKRIDGAANIGAHKTSMLQDLEANRLMEIDAIVGSVAELGRLVGIKTPLIDATYALVRRKAIESNCYQE